jgi:hypothetical protein
MLRAILDIYYLNDGDDSLDVDTFLVESHLDFLQQCLQFALIVDEYNTKERLGENSVVIRELFMGLSKDMGRDALYTGKVIDKLQFTDNTIRNLFNEILKGEAKERGNTLWKRVIKELDIWMPENKFSEMDAGKPEWYLHGVSMYAVTASRQ